MTAEPKDQKVTDSIPRSAVLQLFQVLGHIDSSGGRSTFEQVRQLILKRSPRAAPVSQTAKYTVARDVLLDLQRLELIQAGMLPRTQSQLESLSDAPCELTNAGRALADSYRESIGQAYNQLLLSWINYHPYFRAFITRVHQQPLYVPDVTSVKQIGNDIRSEENLDTLARRITNHCLKRLSAVSFPEAKVEAFTQAIGARVQELGRTTLAGLDTKKWVDTIEDRVVIPALLTAESLPFTDAVTFQHVLKAAKDFLVVSLTTSHPEFSLRVIFPTCEFNPPLTGNSTEAPTQVVHHGKAFATPRFVAALKAAYARVAKTSGDYADAYALRALVCIELQIQAKVFVACLGELLAVGPTPELTIYPELVFDPPPPGEDYIVVAGDRIGLLKITTTTQPGGQ
jgi:hypothetical protein